MAACTKIVPGQDERDVPVCFSPVTGGNTKSVIYGVQDASYNKKSGSNYEKFTAWAKYTDAPGTNPQTGGMEFFPAAGIECVHGGTSPNDYWAPSTTYYWLKDGYFSFHALSPSNLYPYSGDVSHSWSSGITIRDFQAGTNRNQQVDVLYSDFEFKKQRRDYTPESGTPYDESSDPGFNHKGVNLRFHHALASVQFFFKTDGNYEAGTAKYKFKVRRIELMYANNRGEFHENRTSAGDNSYADAPPGSVTFNEGNSLTATPYWIRFSNEVTYMVSDLTACTAVTATSSRIGSQMLVMPQHLSHATHNVSVRIHYNFSYKVGDEAEQVYPDPSDPNYSSFPFYNVTIPLNGLEGTVGGDPCSVNQWLINHSYVYNIVFHLDPLLFDPYISAGWVDVSEIGISLPHVD